MNADVSNALTELVRRGILSPERAALPSRVARGKMTSLYLELRLLFYVGVLLLVAGAGLLVRENFARIGPIGIALALGAGTLACFAWVVRTSPPFSWSSVASPSIAFDYILLLGVLLFTADLAFVEAQFTPLGATWPWHLLLLALVTGAVAVRYDSRTVFSLTLSTFAAWRGLSVSFIERPIWFATDESVRWNAIACGILFIGLGQYLAKSGRKAHFEPVAGHLGRILFLGALASGVFDGGSRAIGYALGLMACGAAMAFYAYQERRFGFFAYGILAAYIGTTRLVFEVASGFLFAMFWFAASALGLILRLWKIQRSMKEPL